MKSPRKQKLGKWATLLLPMFVFAGLVVISPKSTANHRAGEDGSDSTSTAGVLAFRAGGGKKVPFTRRRSVSRRVPLFSSSRSSSTNSSSSRSTSYTTKSSQYAKASRPAQRRPLFASSSSTRKEITISKSSATYDRVKMGSRKPSFRYLTASVKRQIDAANISRGRWKYIVVHNSATTKGNAKAFDRYHRNVRGMKNGMAYHFVIGNGSYSGNGEIEIGNRWKYQIQGGHLKSLSQNRVAIGICLVGDFNSQRVRDQQLAALDELVAYLQGKVGKAVVTTHRRINVVPTSCPGRYFPDSKVMVAYNR
ncbi:MAG: peptidoglycan recognition family protein [Verrucomicrobiota bacterium]